MNLDNDKAKKEEKDDILNRYSFAEDIAKNINQVYVNDYESLVIGISGSWGNGKSTLMNFIKDSLEKTDDQSKYNTIILEFNPWIFSNQQSLLEHFFDVLGEKFESKWGKLKKKLKKQAGQLIDKTEILEEIIPDYVKPIKSIFASLVKDKNIEKKKKELSDILIEGKIRLFIFIDDLDRLTPQEITQIFQLIKLNADFSNTIFFVAYDKDVIVQALSNEYKINGNKYLEKIIQVDYIIPGIQAEKIEEIFTKQLNDLMLNLNIEFNTNELKHAWFKSLKYYINNLRDIKRYINSITLRLPSIKDKVVIRDFLLLESIRVFDFNAYDFLHSNYYQFREITSKNRSIGNDPVGFFQKAFGEVNAIENIATAEILSILLSKTYSTSKDHIRNFSNLEYYEIYFTLLLPKKHVSEEDLRIYLSENSSSQKLLIMNKIQEDGRIDNFFNRLSNISVQDSSLSNPAIITSLFDFLDKNINAFFQYHSLIHSALINIITLTDSGIETFFKDILHSKPSSFCHARFYYMILITEDEMKNISINRRENYITEKNKYINDINSKLNSDLKHWSSFIINNKETPIDYTYIFLKHLNQIFPEQFIKDIYLKLESEQGCVWFVDLFISEFSSPATPFLVHTDWLNKIISSDIKDSIIEKLSKVRDQLLIINNKEKIQRLINSIKEYVN